MFTDYAHHPDELKATLAAAKAAAGGRLVTLFQPHTFSRLHDLFDDFAASFGDSSLPLFTDVFSAREVNTSGVHAGLLADAAGGVYLLTLRNRALSGSERPPGDTVLLIGAGNVNTVWDIIKTTETQNVGLFRRVHSVKSAQGTQENYRNVCVER
ncbi:MAG: glutamate ligase domain-containing protein [Acutalibacteraceae bacterium]